MGYTTAFDAAIPPLAARHAHEEFEDTPCLDKGFFVLMGNNHFIMESIQRNEPERLRSFIAWLLGAAKGFTPKVVNPGGVEVWKQLPSGNVRGIDENVTHFEVTPRQIIEQIARAVDELRLPHSLHLHANNLGMPGNWQTTLETMKTFGDSRGHLAHIQFHSYGGGEGDETTFNSKVVPLVEYVDSHKNLTVDVGQVLFGETTTMTADGPLGYYLSNAFKTKWFSSDTEMESGCGIAPIEYRNTSLVHSLQWAIGLEWYLLAKDPWRVVMSTDHPNGGSFLAYPQIIKLLMDRTYREDMLKLVHPAVLERSTLKDLTREYTLSEICIITRSGPARILGLEHKGHLGPGADADITIYTPDDDKEKMFETPRVVIKAGVVIVDQGEIRDPAPGKLLYVAPAYDTAIERDIAEWFEKYYSIRFRNYPVSLEYLHEHEEVATGAR
jgi:formylmethanofuran dehydrogenase subunit A